MIQLLAIAAILAVISVAKLWLRPFRTCGQCNGRGHCARCRFTGKVPRAGARLVRRTEIRRWKGK